VEAADREAVGSGYRVDRQIGVRKYKDERLAGWFTTRCRTMRSRRELCLLSH